VTASVAVKKLTLDLARLAQDGAQLNSERGRELIGQALASGNGPLSARAAELVAEQQLDGFEPALRSA
jgi:hypothetical protein